MPNVEHDTRPPLEAWNSMQRELILAMPSTLWERTLTPRQQQELWVSLFGSIASRLARVGKHRVALEEFKNRFGTFQQKLITIFANLSQTRDAIAKLTAPDAPIDFGTLLKELQFKPEIEYLAHEGTDEPCAVRLRVKFNNQVVDHIVFPLEGEAQMVDENSCHLVAA